jgi:excinuclease ABC subunit B
VKELIDGVLQAPAIEGSDDDILLQDVRLDDEKSVAKAIKGLEKKMLEHARNLEFEQAAAARDALNKLKTQILQSGV